MLQSNCRISTEDRITFYEKDVLYDNHIYSGDCRIEVSIDYVNNGFGLMLINATSHSLNNSNSIIMFKLNHKTLEVIYKENDLQRVLGSYRAALSLAGTDDLKIVLQKQANIFSVSIGGYFVTEFKSDYDLEDYYIGFYSNKDNVINNISIASAIPYGWIVNMQHTNGGYIDFISDGFSLVNCSGLAEVEQIEIPLPRGTYYLKYDLVDSDIKPYVFLSHDDRINDDEKNILNGIEFSVSEDETLVSLKFKGTKGTIKNIAITTSKSNSYIRTSPDFDNIRIIDESLITIILDNVDKFSFKALVSNVPAEKDEYFIIECDGQNYDIDDINLAIGVFYSYEYESLDSGVGLLNIYNPNYVLVNTIDVKGNIIKLFSNTNSRIKDFIIHDYNGTTSNVTLEDELRDTIPGIIKSPVVITDGHDLPFDLSSSYRYYYENGMKKYHFTNTEREYFEPRYSIKLTDKAIDSPGSVIVYCVKKYSRFELDRLLEVKNPSNDTIDACADSYDVLFEENLRYINKETGEIRFSNIDNYQMIIVDYVKDNSYCLNYNYTHNRYDLAISVLDGEEVNVIYDNYKYTTKDLQYMNEVHYYNTKMAPTVSGYIVIGGGSN